jgi:NADH-quinone oxidoreductase subunit N
MSLPTAAQWSALLPAMYPALAACVILLMSLDKDQATQKWIRGAMYGTGFLALAGSFFSLAEVWHSGVVTGAYQQMQMDRLGQFGQMFVVVAGALTLLQSWDHFHQEGWVKGETVALLLLSLSGMMVFVSTTHLLVLFLALELFSLPLYALVATVRLRPEASEGGMKYFITGAVAASFFLMGAVLLYGLTGELDLVLIARRIGEHHLGSDPLLLAGGALLILGLLFKLSAAPFHQWTPDAYEAAPAPIAGFMSVATKGVALMALLRAFPGALSGAGLGPKAQSAVAALAVLTLIFGNLSALVQVRVKRMLAYSSIAHAGYLMLGLVAGTPAAHAGMLFYLVVYLAMNLGAFGLLTAWGVVGDKDGFEDLRGLGWRSPLLGLFACLFMLSLAGIPPLGGFYGKYLIFKELVGTGHVGLAIFGVLASLVSVGYYLRLLVALYLQAPTAQQEREAAERPVVRPHLARAALWICAFIVVASGFCQQFLAKDFAGSAATSLAQLR